MNTSGSDERLLAGLFDLPAAERAAGWQRLCAEHAGLRERFPTMARVLADGQAPAAPALSEDGVARVLELGLDSADRETVGTHIGPYKLLQKIGEGGFGTVWMAEQAPLQRRVALKIVKAGMDTDEVIARFEAERQALALLDHPNIAHVFDAGATAAGRPFFVMELVRGVPITRYCDDNRLSAEARLQLFLPVCHAVQHAHQKGIIHRDLKPSNILVTLHDGLPVPKIIDFGIAKATGKRLTAKTLVTQFHAFVGTPVYTSPEQMEMSGLDVDTRSDVYSLGVLLYELLAGRPPFDPDALVKSGLDAMRRTIREVDPPRPSHRLGTLSEADRTSVAHQRSTDAAKLRLLLRGDVDWIVMRCLEKDRTRRYETANALAQDVERHLVNEPVTARPPSSLYRLQKLFRRHRFGVIAAGAIAVSLIGGLIASSALLVRERAARSRAVAAEASESRLRQQAEAARGAEALRAGRTSLALAEQLLREGRTSEGLAHLVRAARSDPANSGVGPRLIAALAYRSFAEPLGRPLQHPGAIGALSYRDDGHHALSWSEGAVRYWDLDSGRMLQSIEVGDTTAGEPSPDGRRVAVAGGIDGGVTVWDLESGRRVLGPLRQMQGVRSIRFSPDGRRLAAGGDDRIVHIWNIATGELETALPLDHAVNGIAFSPDGKRVLTTTLRGPWRIWCSTDGTPVTPQVAFKSATQGGGYFTGGSFSPDGTLVAITDQHGALLFDATTGDRVGERMAHLGPSYSAVFTRDGRKIVTTSDDGTARLWAVPSGMPLRPPFLHGGRLLQPHLTPNERYLLTSCFDGVARVWDLTTGQPALEPIRVGDVGQVDLAADGTEFMTGGRDGAIRRWRLAPGAATPLRLPSDPNRISVQRDPNNTAVAWMFQRDRMQKFDLLTGATLDAPRLFPAPICWAKLAPDHMHLVVRLDSADLEIWDLRGAEIVRHPLGPSTVETSGFSADSSYLTVADTFNTVRVWRTETGTLAIGPIENASKFLSFSPDNRRLAVAMADNSVAIWSPATGLRDRESLRQRSRLFGVEFSPDGRLIATASFDGAAQLWNAETLQPVGPPMWHRTFPRGAVFSRDSRRLLTWTTLETRIWDVTTSMPLTDPMIGGNDISLAVFSADGTRVATWARTNAEVRLWGAVSGQLLAEPVRVSGSLIADSQFGFIASDRFLSIAVRASLAVWPVPPQSAHQPVPDWLLRLAIVVAGGEIDARAVFREQAFSKDAHDEIRHELAALPATAPYVEWGRWFLADRATRPIAPWLAVTAAQLARRAVTEASATDEP